MTDWLEPFSTTGIGSLPHLDPVEAASLCLDAVDIPFWPQLPALSFRESMVAQYSEGMPGLMADPSRDAIWCERNEEEIARFHETASEGARVAVSEDYARGLYAFFGLIGGRRFRALKGHVTGPLTFTLGLTDAAGKPVYYDEELREIGLMLLKAKARWQVDLLGRHAENVIIFIDEPILSALGGTAYMGVGREETARLLAEAARSVREAGGVPGLHCCGRAEWPLALGCGVDIVNFDSYGFGDTLAIYPEETGAFLDRGGVLAWGAVPTTGEAERETEESLLDVFRRRLEALCGGLPQERLLSRVMLTPSCGAGSRSVGEAVRIYQLLMRLKEALR